MQVSYMKSAIRLVHFDVQRFRQRHHAHAQLLHSHLLALLSCHLLVHQLSAELRAVGIQLCMEACRVSSRGTARKASCSMATSLPCSPATCEHGSFQSARMLTLHTYGGLLLLTKATAAPQCVLELAEQCAVQTSYAAQEVQLRLPCCMCSMEPENKQSSTRHATSNASRQQGTLRQASRLNSSTASTSDADEAMLITYASTHCVPRRAHTTKVSQTSATCMHSWA